MVSEEEPGAQSRRTLLSAAGALAVGGLGSALAACGSSSHAATQAPPAATPLPGDVEHLNRALDFEYLVAAAYTAATPLLHGRDRATAKRFLGQELAHVSRLIDLIKHGGGKAHDPQPSYDLGHPRDAAGLLALLHSVESYAFAGALDLLPRLLSGKARHDLTAIIADDAQHVTVLRRSMGRDPLPVPFPDGRQ